MKINEIITESKERLRQGAERGIPDLETYDYLDNNNHPYMAYRFGIALAVSPDTHMDREGPIGSKFTTIGYTDADREIIEKAKQIIGVKGTKHSSGKTSQEMDFVNTQSPFQPRGPVKRKSK